MQEKMCKKGKWCKSRVKVDIDPQQISDLWNQESEQEWNKCLKEKYWSLVAQENILIEKELEKITPDKIRCMSVEQFYSFLYDKYFVWKYTAKNRLATTRKYLMQYAIEDGEMNELEKTHEKLFSFELSDTLMGLKIAKEIRGLGFPGASGLLSILFPEHFGVVDQFVVKALRKVNNLPEYSDLLKMNPDSLGLRNSKVLIDIFQKKAVQLNQKFHTEDWTPRKVDQVLWTVGHFHK